MLGEHGVSLQLKSPHDGITPHRRAQLAGHDEIAEYLFARIEGTRKTRSPKASRDRVSQLVRHGSLRQVEDGVAVPTSNDATTVNTDRPDMHILDGIAEEPKIHHDGAAESPRSAGSDAMTTATGGKSTTTANRYQAALGDLSPRERV